MSFGWRRVWRFGGRVRSVCGLEFESGVLLREGKLLRLLRGDHRR